MSLVFALLLFFQTVAALPIDKYISQGDQQFLNTAAETDRAEIALARLILRRHAGVKAESYARRMLADHSTDLRRLQGVARREKTLLPTGPSPAGQRDLDSLSSSGASGLGMRYLQGAVRDHRQAILTYRRELAKTPSPLIHDYVRATLPMLQAHLRMAQDDVAMLAGRP